MVSSFSGGRDHQISTLWKQIENCAGSRVSRLLPLTTVFKKKGRNCKRTPTSPKSQYHECCTWSPVNSCYHSLPADKPTHTGGMRHIPIILCAPSMMMRSNIKPISNPKHCFHQGIRSRNPMLHAIYALARKRISDFNQKKKTLYLRRKDQPLQYY